MNQKRILVTGGSGFLGAALVKRLLLRGHFVRVLDNGSRLSTQRLCELGKEAEIAHADIRDPIAVAKAIRGMDLVVHLAAVNGTEFFYQKPDVVLDVGVRGILNVLDGCIQEGVGDLIAASSSEVYQTPQTLPTDETEALKIPDPLNPRYSYGGSKIITELLTLNYGRLKLKRALLFRPHNVYGPAMGTEHVLPQFILKALKAIEKTPKGPLPFPIQGDGKQTRAFIHIEDMIDGIELLIEKGKHLNIYHIGNPEEISMAHLAKKVVHYLGRQAKIEPGEPALGSTERRCPNIDKMKELGFLPKISIEEGIQSTIQWYVNNL